MKPFLTLTRLSMRAFTRDKTGLFWSFFFPVFFLLIFGGLNNRKRDDIQVSVGMAVEDASPEVAWLGDAFRKVPSLKITEKPLPAMMEDLKSGKLRGVIVIPAGSADRMKRGEKVEVEIRHDPGVQMSRAAIGIVNGIISGVDLKATQYKPKFAAKMVEISPDAAGGKKLSGIDYFLPGILAMTIMQLGLFTAIPIVNMREKGILKRFRATPLSRPALVSATIAQRVVIALFQTGVIIVLGMAAFKFRVLGAWFPFLGILLLGTLSFICIGSLLSTIAKTQEAAVSIVQLVNMPMIFLSNMFIPVELLPKAILPIANALPATYLSDALRATMLGQPATFSMGMNLAMIGGWGIACAFLSARLFRWE